MKKLFALFVVLAACGGSQKPAPQPEISNNTPPSGTETTAPPPANNGPDPMCASHPDELGPWVLTADQMSQRYGTGVHELAKVPTTKEHTIEVCGVPAENTWLATSVCADGKTHPYHSPMDVEQSRAGNVGEGGRCGGIIDLYKVQCPEKTYDVYIDMNLCGPGESFM
ncbi:MAG TPA: hypothetical protein VL463_24370 [Kofleriaceae bacterium]|jgi:hypothetical protein|nr:hypothetical protein [Kofleriaceae bacterium]